MRSGREITLDGPTQVAPGVLRLGARVETQGSVSWTPATEQNQLPLNVYLLTSESSALVVDTGPAVLHPALAEQITELTAGRELHVAVTRNDPEAMGGVGELLPHHDVRTFYYYGGGSILEWVWDSADGPGASGDLFDTVPIASPPNIDIAGLGRMRVLHPPLAVLSTVWLFHEPSATLFTSDAFGYVAAAAPGTETPVLDEVGDVDADRARAYVAARFDWVDRLNNTHLVDELRTLLDPLDIAAIAPSHGVVVRGRPAVGRYLDTLFSALSTSQSASVFPSIDRG